MIPNSTYHIDLISRYFSGEANSEEISALLGWIKADSENQKLFDEYNSVWQDVEKTKINSEINVDFEWNQFKSKIHQSIQNTESKIISLTPEIKISNRLLFNVFRIAAVFVVVLLASFVIYKFVSQPETKLLIAQNGTIEGKLPDGTSVTLNSGSVIEYPEKFSDKKRNIKLKGEAYFQVTHNEKQAFVIGAEDLKVEVLGTSFYVNTNTENGNIEVILTSGKVALYHKDKPEEKIFLAPGEKAEFSKTNLTITKSVNDEKNYMAWKTKKILFMNDPLSEIVKTINKIYHSNIELSSSKISNCKITATFDHQPLDAVLNVLKETLNLNVKNSGTKIEISGEGCK